MPINDALSYEQWVRFVQTRDRGHLAFLEKADRCDKMFVGEQWDTADANALLLQRRPALTINKIISTIGTLLGEQIDNRAEVLFRPSGGADAATAEALTKVWQQMAQDNQLPWARSEWFADGLIRSRGFLDVRLDFADNMQGEVKITNLNSKNVVVDPDAEEYDPDKWMDVFVTKWMTPQDVAILYSEADAEYLKLKEGSSFVYGYDSIERVRDRFGGALPLSSYYGTPEPNGVRRNIRVLDRQYRKLDKQLHFVDVKTGDMRPVPAAWDRDRIAQFLERTGGTLSTTKKLVKRIRWTVTADNVVLHDDWSPYKHFTVVPYFPYFRYGRTVGIVEQLISSQELLNKVSSQELHVVNTSANSGWKIRAGALKNMSIEELEQKGATTGLVMELDDVSNAEKIVPNATPQGLDRISYKAEEHIKTISAVSDSMQGFDREDVAAKAIAYKQQRGVAGMSKVLDNLERSDYLLARNVLDIVQEFYTEERLVTIIKGDASHEVDEVTVNEYDEVTGEIKNDLTLGEYSIVITSTPARASMEDSQFEQLMAMKKEGMAVPDHFLIESSRLMRKADIIKEMAGNQDSPEAQQQAQLKARAEEASVSKLEAEAADKQADAKLRMAKVERELALTDTERAKMGGDADGDNDAAMQQQQMALNQDAHAHKKDLAEREFALKQQAQEHAQQLAQQQHDQQIQQQQADALRQTAQPEEPQPKE